jgi:hypothetical protein
LFHYSHAPKSETIRKNPVQSRRETAALRSRIHTISLLGTSCRKHDKGRSPMWGLSACRRSQIRGLRRRRCALQPRVAAQRPPWENGRHGRPYPKGVTAGGMVASRRTSGLSGHAPRRGATQPRCGRDGIRISAPRVAAQRLPWQNGRLRIIATPPCAPRQGGPPSHGTQPLCGRGGFCISAPRVAPAAQPWAEGRDPVGVFTGSSKGVRMNCQRATDHHDAFCGRL